jgi:hypothetical protein
VSFARASRVASQVRSVLGGGQRYERVVDRTTGDLHLGEDLRELSGSLGAEQERRGKALVQKPGRICVP